MANQYTNWASSIKPAAIPSRPRCCIGKPWSSSKLSGGRIGWNRYRDYWPDCGNRTELATTLPASGVFVVPGISQFPAIPAGNAAEKLY